MKKNIILITFVAVFMSIFSCTKKNEAIGIEIDMRNGYGTTVSINDLSLYITSDDNFEYNFGYSANIASVGSVRKLGAIKSIPESGWAKKIAVHPGYGYVLKSNDGRYARLYVSSWTYAAGTSGAIIGAMVEYQENWEP